MIKRTHIDTSLVIAVEWHSSSNRRSSLDYVGRTRDTSYFTDRTNYAMNTSRESLKLWLSDVLTADGAYGATADRPAAFDPDRDPRHASRPKQTQRLSSVVASGRLTVPAGGGPHAATDTRLTVKLKPPVELLRTVLKSDRQFHNEMHAYQNVVPFLFEHLPDGARGPALPAFVYGRNESGARWSEDVIVLEDPRGHGYVPARTPEHVAGAGSAHMDYGHLAVAIAALGRFHGMSFTAKQKNPVAFRKLVGNLREIQWDEDGWLVKGNGLKSMSMRGARPLMDQDKYRDGKLKGFLTMIREADRNLKLAMTPKEPFAVICHGDYCKPNILFEYDEAGQPRDAMITEFTAVRYGSPGLDLSYFLYKNADKDVQDNRWEDLLAVYLESVAAVLPADVKAPTAEQLHHELRFHALYGYAHLLFAVPNMINDNPRGLLDIDNDDDKTTVEDLLVARIDGADEKITEILSGTVRHIIDHGYAEQYEFPSNNSRL